MLGPNIEFTELKTYSVVCHEPACTFNATLSHKIWASDLLHEHRKFHIERDPWKFHFLSDPGPYLWQICDECNYNRHWCHFCGEGITHAEQINQTHPCYAELVNPE